jgi:hypothetical protein
LITAFLLSTVPILPTFIAWLLYHYDLFPQLAPGEAMPGLGKSKKDKSTASDDFDDIIAESVQHNASIASSSSSSSSAKKINSYDVRSNIRSNTSSSSSSKQATPTEEKFIKLCKRDDLAGLKWCIKRGAKVTSLNFMVAGATSGKT